MKIKIKKLVDHAVIPKYAKAGDGALDLTAISKELDEYGNVVYGTGLAFEIPDGFFMMLLPRSSNCKSDLMLTNHCGIVDSGYRGEVSFKFAPYQRLRTRDVVIKNAVGLTDLLYRPYHKVPKETFHDYEIGDRVGQLIVLPYPTVEFEEVEELSQTERGQSGYGSSGK